MSLQQTAEDMHRPLVFSHDLYCRATFLFWKNLAREVAELAPFRMKVADQPLWAWKQGLITDSEMDGLLHYNLWRGTSAIRELHGELANDE